MKEFVPTPAGETGEEPHSNFVSKGFIPLPEKLTDRPLNGVAQSSAIEVRGDAQDLAELGALQQFGA